MEYRHLGNSGLRVSVAGLGTNSFGRRMSVEESHAVVNRSLDLGVNFFDTADIYGEGLSEEHLGRAIRGRRQHVVVATKFERPMGRRELEGGASRRHIMRAVQESIRRLGVDYIDLYQFHFWDPATPIEESLRALDDVVRRGDVRYIGCSNFTAWQIVEAQWTARSEHLNPLISAQNPYNLLERDVERELVPVCAKYGLGVIPYYPLASGFLTGKYRPGEPPPPGSRFSGGWAPGATYLQNARYDTLAALERFAAERDHTVGELALAWLGSQPGVGSVIAGASRPEQVEANVHALEWRLSPDDLQALDAALDEKA